MLDLTFKKVVGKALLPENRDQDIIELLHAVANQDLEHLIRLEYNARANNEPLWNESVVDALFINSGYRKWNNMYTAIHDGKVIGITMTCIRDKTCYLFAVSVNENYRKQGVCRFLMDEIVKLADEQEVTSMCLEVMSNDPDAFAAYKALGFETYTLSMFKEI